MGPDNYTSIQLALEFWDYYAEVNFLKDQKHIIFFMAGTFRCNNKYTYRGGIRHFSQRGQDNAEFVVSSGLKIEKASYGEHKQPPVTTPVPVPKIKLNSWENRLAELAADMTLNPDKEEYADGYKLDPEETDASPLAHMTLQIYIEILQRGINYEKKRKVISALNEAKDEIAEYIAEARKDVQELYDEAKEEYAVQRIQLFDYKDKIKEDITHIQNEISSMIKDCNNKLNLHLNKRINKAKESLEVILEVLPKVESDIETIYKKIDGLYNKIGKRIGKRRLFKLLEQERV